MATTLTGFGQATGQVSLACNAPTLNVKGNTNAQTIASAGFTRSLTFVYGAGATALYVDTIANFVRQIAVSPGTDILTVSALVGTSTSGTTTTAMTDCMGQATPVFARMRGLFLELLTTGDTVATLDPTPTAAVSITVGNAVAAKWTAPIDSTGTITILNAESFCKVTRTAAGMAIGSGTSDQLKILNNDSVVAVYRGILFGTGT